MFPEKEETEEDPEVDGKIILISELCNRLQNTKSYWRNKNMVPVIIIIISSTTLCEPWLPSESSSMIPCPW
jgi:hypothetical protein